MPSTHDMIALMSSSLLSQENELTDDNPIAEDNSEHNDTDTSVAMEVVSALPESINDYHCVCIYSIINVQSFELAKFYFWLCMFFRSFCQYFNTVIILPCAKYLNVKN